MVYALLRVSVLSIQSHVAYGYVGNKSAVYPLQAMGYDVWPINTVQFSNHTGYKIWQGEIFSCEHIRDVAAGIESLGVVHSCQAIISGYMGSAAICAEVLAIVKRFKAINPDILYLCDPVIGSNACYVRPEVLDFFKNSLQADIVVPNQLEAETLSGISIKDFDDAREAVNFFHSLGVRVVVIKGLEFPAEDCLWIVASDGANMLQMQQRKYCFEVAPNGTGDLFSALFLGHFLSTKNVVVSLQKAASLTEQVLSKTFAAKSRELKILDVDYRI